MVHVDTRQADGADDTGEVLGRGRAGRGATGGGIPGAASRDARLPAVPARHLYRDPPAVVGERSRSSRRLLAGLVPEPARLEPPHAEHVDDAAPRAVADPVVRDAEPPRTVIHGHHDHPVTGLAQERRDESMKAVEEMKAVDAAPMHRPERARAAPHP